MTMRRCAYLAAVALPIAPVSAQVEMPAALVADGIPAVPAELAAKTRPYMGFRTASFVGWHPTDKTMILATRFANTAQLHRVSGLMMARKQMSFEVESVTGGGWAAKKADIFVAGNDPRVPASEADQIIRVIRAKGGTAWLLLGTNEGHGFAKKENIDYQFWSSLMFWEKTSLGAPSPK